MKCCAVLSHFNHIILFAAPRTIALRAPLPMEFSRQEYWSDFPCPPPRDLPYPETEPTSLMSPALVGSFFTSNATWEVEFSNLFFSYGQVCFLPSWRNFTHPRSTYSSKLSSSSFTIIDSIFRSIDNIGIYVFNRIRQHYNSVPLCVLCPKSLQLCLTVCNPMDCSLARFFCPWILQARILVWAAMPSSRASSRPRDWTGISCSSYG